MPPLLISIPISLLFPPEFVFPYPEDDGGVQARLVWKQRGVVRLPVLPTEQVSLVKATEN